MLVDDKKKVLIDLKPAFDGHSGIPLETRQIFVNFSSFEWAISVGFIQRGSGYQLYRIIKNERIFARYTAWVSNKLSKIYLNLINRNTIKTKKITSNESKIKIWNNLFLKSFNNINVDAQKKFNYCYTNTPRIEFFKSLRKNTKTATQQIWKLKTEEFNVMIAQSPIPVQVSRMTKLIIRLHDMIPISHTELTRHKHVERLDFSNALELNIKMGAWFSCVSETTKCEFLKYYPEAESRAFVIYNYISETFYIKQKNISCAQNIILNKGGYINPTDYTTFKYFICVSTIEPRKNYARIITAWERLRAMGSKSYLVIVGNNGWDSDDVYKKILINKTYGLIRLSNISTEDLRDLYRNSIATICGSLNEGFDYPAVESMYSGSNVIASDIAVHKELLGNYATYFDPTSIEQLEQHLIKHENSTNINSNRLESSIYRPSKLDSENIGKLWKIKISKVLENNEDINF